MLKAEYLSRAGLTEKENGELETIIFDLGGVVINIEYERTIRAFHDLGFGEFGQIYTQLNQEHLFDLFETGKIGPPEFRSMIKQYSPDAKSDEQIDQAWCAMLLDLPVERMQLIHRLGKRYRTFLLSNTNQIHIEYYNEYIKEYFGEPNLSFLFEKDYYSHSMGKRKPNQDIYKQVIDEQGLNPSHTLFVDDLSPNIEGARAVGLVALHLEKPLTILDIFA
jgi:glucose-1-phosphatase